MGRRQGTNVGRVHNRGRRVAPFKESQKMGPKPGEVSLDINEIAQSLKKKTTMLETLSSNSCIYKVPPHLYTLDKEAYTPKIVSIGPFHHEKLKSMETHKLRYLKAFLERIEKTMEEYIEELKKHETPLRESYAGIDGYDREKFIEMMAVDGAFLMQLLLMCYDNESEKIDQMFGRQQLFSNVKFDLLLIENQLPFFYLEGLFFVCQQSNEKYKKITLIEITKKFLNEVAGGNWDLTGRTIPKERPEHLLHFLIICLNQLERAKGKKCTSISTPTISELHHAGVKFKPSSTHCLSSIRFANKIMQIPKLTLTDDAEMFFRNMQAFEHCHKLDCYVRDYICIMDVLVDGEEDMKVLVENGIIDNCLEDNKVAARVFNNLSKGNDTNVDDFSYTSVVENLNVYYKAKRHKWKAMLKQDYFGNPWTIISFVAASVLLLLTITQTICSIIGVV